MLRTFYYQVNSSSKKKINSQRIVKLIPQFKKKKSLVLQTDTLHPKCALQGRFSDN